MEHDQVWKEVIWTFFERFIRLFFPQVAAALDFSTAQLVEGEVFTDVPEGSRREPDVVVQVSRLDGATEIILVHVEVQSERRGNMPYRMWEYYSLLRLRKKLPVFPIVVFLVPGAGGLVSESYHEELFGKRILDFAYEAVGLPDLSAEEYIDLDDPLAVSLSALMRSADGSRVKRWLQAMERLSFSGLDDARTWLLAYIVDKYVTLTEEEKEEMSQLTSFDPASPERYKKGLMLSFEEAAWDRGIEKGREEGREQGREQGKHDLIERLLRRKFGEASAPVIARVMAIDDLGRLDDLAERLLTAATVDDLGLS